MKGLLTVRVCYEDLLYPAHLHGALLYLVLCGLATIEEPNIAVKTEG